MDAEVAQLGQVDLAGEVDLLRQVSEIRVLVVLVVLVGGRYELAAVVGVGRPHHPDVGEQLPRDAVQR